jgi:hypothetical protein
MGNPMLAICALLATTAIYEIHSYAPAKKSSHISRSAAKAKSQAKDKRAKRRQKYAALRRKVGVAPLNSEVWRRMSRVAFWRKYETSKSIPFFRAHHAAHAFGNYRLVGGFNAQNNKAALSI